MPRTVFPAVMALAGFVFAFAFASNAAEPPNLQIIVADDLGYSYFGYCGSIIASKWRPDTKLDEHEGNRAIRNGQRKLIALKDQPWELYDGSDTRTERHNLASDPTDHVGRLSAEGNRWAKINFRTPLPDDCQIGYLNPTPAAQ